MSSQSHMQALMKAFDDTYVPGGTSSDNVAAMIHQVIRGHLISFYDDELPFEGRSHNKAFHITVVCCWKVVNCVIVDDGSGLNIYSLSTLRQLRFDLGKLEQNQVNLRAFDGVQRDTLGVINLMPSDNLVNHSDHIITACADGHIRILKRLHQGLSMQLIAH